MSTTMECCLIVMAKAPRAGLVKTRLVPPLSAEQAAELYEAMLHDCVDHSYAPQSWKLVLAFHPEEERDYFEELVADRDIELAVQTGDGLPARMDTLFAALSQQHDRVCMRNTDSPQLSPDVVKEAFSKLDDDGDLVFGPDKGGGYYLVGMKEFRPGVFDAPPSTLSNYADSKRQAFMLGYRTHELGEQRDIDQAHDLDALCEELRSSGATSCPKTYAWLKKCGRLS